MGSALGVSALISCCAVAIYMHYQRQKHALLQLQSMCRQCSDVQLLHAPLRYAVSVGTEDQEIVQRSEGGYRMKKMLGQNDSAGRLLQSLEGFW